jgi:uncharacterized protein YutE (UPF0331/DUF86 family)
VAELDRERILIKLDQLDGYLRELASIAPRTFAEYQGVEKRRACERLLQLSVEVVIDICWPRPSMWCIGIASSSA